MTRRKGAVLILVLFVMVVLSLVAVSFSYRAALARRLATQRAMMLRLEHHARSAAAIALTRLPLDPSGFVHPAQAWCSHVPLAEEPWLPEWSPDQAGETAEYVTDYQVIDEEGKLHVAVASSEAMKKLGMSNSQAACLFDWMDEDDVTRSEGAEDGFYLARAPSHYCKNAALESLEELLRIRGFGSDDYYGRLREGDPSPEGSTATRGWVRLLTTRGDGYININTSPLEVLKTLPLSQGAAEQIVAYRRFTPGAGQTLDDHAFRNADDIRQLQGLTEADRDVLQAVAKFRSEHFRILVESRHVPSGLTYRLDVLAKTRSPDQPEILEWKGEP